MRWWLFGVLVLSGCALFEADTEPALGPLADGGAKADSGPVDAGELPDANGMDASLDSGDRADADADDVSRDMSGTGSFDCPSRTLTGGPGSPNSHLQIEMLGNQSLIVGRRAEDTLLIFDLIDRAGILSTITATAPVEAQDFVILADPNADDWYFATTNGDMVLCTNAACNTQGQFSTSRSIALTGDWNGGDFLPYLQFFDGRNIVTGAWSTDRLIVAMSNAPVSVTTPDWIDLALASVPPSPGLSTWMHGGALFGDDLYYHERVASAEPVDQSAKRCQVTPRTSAKFELTRDSERLVTSVSQGGETYVAETSCSISTPILLTEPIQQLRDWAQVVEGDITYTFYVTDSRLLVDVHSPEGIESHVIAFGDFQRVDATRYVDDGFAVVTINASELVELHTFDLTGKCL